MVAWLTATCACTSTERIRHDRVRHLGRLVCAGRRRRALPGCRPLVHPPAARRRSECGASVPIDSLQADAAAHVPACRPRRRSPVVASCFKREASGAIARAGPRSRLQRYSRDDQWERRPELTHRGPRTGPVATRRGLWAVPWPVLGPARDTVNHSDEPGMIRSGDVPRSRIRPEAISARAPIITGGGVTRAVAGPPLPDHGVPGPYPHRPYFPGAAVSPYPLTSPLAFPDPEDFQGGYPGRATLGPAEASEPLVELPAWPRNNSWEAVFKPVSGPVPGANIVPAPAHSYAAPQETTSSGSAPSMAVTAAGDRGTTNEGTRGNVQYLCTYHGRLGGCLPGQHQQRSRSKRAGYVGTCTFLDIPFSSSHKELISGVP